MKLTGTIKRNDLEGGTWTLVTKCETYTLTGTVAGAKDGMLAEVEGQVDKGAMGIGLMGKQLAVSKITAVK